MRRTLLKLLVLIACAFSCCSIEQVGAARFVPLGYLPGGGFFSQANDISANGTVIVGGSDRGELGDEAFRWTAKGGMQGLGDFVTGAHASVANAVSDDGSVIVGDGTIRPNPFTRVDGFRWTAETGLVPIGYLPNDPREFDYSNALGVSGDGAVVVGGSRSFDGNEPFIWTPESGIIGLGHTPETPLPSIWGDYAYDVSSDGRSVVGSMRTEIASEAFRWTKEEGIVGLGFLPGFVIESHANAISSDGTTIVGHSGRQGWYWTDGTGMVALPYLSGINPTSIIPMDVTANGSIIVGASSTNHDSSPAFVWTASRGTERLQQFLEEEYGLEFHGWTLTSANAISDDGKLIVGRGINLSRRHEAWLVDLRIPEPQSVNFLLLGILTIGLRIRLPRYSVLTCSPKS